MYKKTIKRGENEYTYYYTNVRKDGKVRNIFLSSDKKEARKLEKELKANDYYKIGSSDSIQPEKRIIRYGGAKKPFEKSFTKNGLNQILLFLGILIASGLFFYFFNGITGYSVVDDNIELEVNRYVGLNSTVFLTVDLNE